MGRVSERTALGKLYDLATGDEDARVCRDIPESACDDQPRNFFLHIAALVATKGGDRLAGVKLVLPWLLTSLGAPAFMSAWLVPMRESLALLPQLAVAAAIRRVAVRKWFWVAGSIAQGAAVLGMAAVAATLRGAAAGWTLLGLLVVFSLARGVCSVAAKDVMGKTVSKTRRGRVSGFAASAAGALAVIAGLFALYPCTTADAGFFSALLVVAGALWLVAALLFSFLREAPGATEGGRNALHEAITSLRLLREDTDFRNFLVTRALLVSTALMAPFLVVLANRETGGALEGLGLMLVANGGAATLTAPLWGRFADRSSRKVMAVAAAAAAALGAGVFAYTRAGAPGATGYIYAGFFLLLGAVHTGVRIGRKTYLVDLASAGNRASYVAVSNTVIGIVLLAGGAFGFVAERFGPGSTLLALAILAALAVPMALQLPEVQ